VHRQPNVGHWQSCALKTGNLLWQAAQSKLPERHSEAQLPPTIPTPTTPTQHGNRALRMPHRQQQNPTPCVLYSRTWPSVQSDSKTQKHYGWLSAHQTHWAPVRLWHTEFPWLMLAWNNSLSVHPTFSRVIVLRPGKIPPLRGGAPHTFGMKPSFSTVTSFSTANQSVSLA